MSSIQFDLSPAECEALPWQDRIAGYAVDVTVDAFTPAAKVTRVAEYAVQLPHGCLGMPLADANVRELLKLGYVARRRVLYRDGSEEA